MKPRTKQNIRNPITKHDIASHFLNKWDFSNMFKHRNHQSLLIKVLFCKFFKCVERNLSCMRQLKTHMFWDIWKLFAVVADRWSPTRNWLYSQQKKLSLLACKTLFNQGWNLIWTMDYNIKSTAYNVKIILLVMLDRGKQILQLRTITDKCKNYKQR